jgi:hypothetical protein
MLSLPTIFIENPSHTQPFSNITDFAGHLTAQLHCTSCNIAKLLKGELTRIRSVLIGSPVHLCRQRSTQYQNLDHALATYKPQDLWS